MRPTSWLPFGFVLLFPAAGLIGACGPDVESTTSGGGGSTTTTQGGGGTTTSPGGGGVGGEIGGSGGGIGGTGGFEIPPNDVCNGESITLAVGAATTVNGTLNGATDDYMTFCSDTTPDKDAADVVYQLDVPAEVTATLKIAGNGFDPILSLRRQDCSNRFNADACLPGQNGVIEEKTALAAGPAWIIVEGANGKTGNFQLEVKFDAPKCGDGVINPGEKCDPAVPTLDDGCHNPGTGAGKECQFGEAPPDPAIVSCPGGLITIGTGDSFQLGPYNNGPGGLNYTNITDAVECTSEAGGPENVFHIVPKGDGVLTAVIGHDEDKVSLFCDNHPPEECGDFIMYLRQNACNSAAAGDQLSCDDFTENPNAPFGYDELLTVKANVTANKDYWLIVDGLDDMFGVGAYYLEVDLQ